MLLPGFSILPTAHLAPCSHCNVDHNPSHHVQYMTSNGKPTSDITVRKAMPWPSDSPEINHFHIKLKANHKKSCQKL